jgi:hypothetical protein
MTTFCIAFYESYLSKLLTIALIFNFADFALSESFCEKFRVQIQVLQFRNLTFG